MRDERGNHEIHGTREGRGGDNLRKKNAGQKYKGREPEHQFSGNLRQLRSRLNILTVPPILCPVFLLLDVSIEGVVMSVHNPAGLYRSFLTPPPGYFLAPSSSISHPAFLPPRKKISQTCLTTDYRIVYNRGRAEGRGFLSGPTSILARSFFHNDRFSRRCITGLSGCNPCECFRCGRMSAEEGRKAGNRFLFFYTWIRSCGGVRRAVCFLYLLFPWR